ncbi:membrane-associated phosphatidylinositol transfer protein 3-like [Petaurus breviceps papuanus]|uniref:membrane-associated phosphatidylinositol transfer protein 3-like n=1 Tax=Petaurus breviceps papuanus TaxID=3040969 RepID=UPI0036DF9622
MATAAGAGAGPHRSRAGEGGAPGAHSCTTSALPPPPAGSLPCGGAQWHVRDIMSAPVESSDDEFFDAREDVAEGKNALLIGMSQWNSNDLVEQIETMGKLDETPGEFVPAPSPTLAWHQGLALSMET